MGFVLEISTDTRPLICAYMSIRKRGDKWQLQEFGLDHKSIQTIEAMKKLLPKSLKNQHEMSNNEEIKFHLPTSILDEMQTMAPSCTFLDWERVNDEDDCGWFYKEILP